MRTLREQTSSLSAIAAQWRVLGLLAVMFARHISRIERSDPRRARQQAEMLEAWVYAALFTLTQQLAVFEAASRNNEYERDMAQLQAIMAGLLVLARYAERVKCRLMARQAVSFLAEQAGEPRPAHDRPVPYDNSS